MTADEYRRYAQRFGGVAAHYAVMTSDNHTIPTPICQQTAREHAELAAHFALCFFRCAGWPSEIKARRELKDRAYKNLSDTLKRGPVIPPTL